MPDQQGADDKKSTKEVVNKKQKQMMGEEGYDVARDEGRVSPAKDKKDATTAPRKGMTPKERKKAMQQAQQKSQMAVNNVVTALRKKYGKDAVMYTQKTSKAKSNEELDLTQVAESLGGYIVESEIDPKTGDIVSKRGEARRFEKKVESEVEKSKREKIRAKKEKPLTKAQRDALSKKQLSPNVKKGIEMSAERGALSGYRADRSTSVRTGPTGSLEDIKKGLKKDQDYYREIRKSNAQDRIAAKKLKKQQNIRTTLDTANTGGPRNQVRKVGSTTPFSRTNVSNAKFTGPEDLLQTQKMRSLRLNRNPEIPAGMGGRSRRLVKRTPSLARKYVTSKTKDVADTAVSTARGLGKITKTGIVNPTFDKFKDSASRAKKIATSVQAPKVGKVGAEFADMGKTALSKVKSGLSVGNLKTVGTRVGKTLFGKGGAFGARTIGKAGAKFGLKRIPGIGSAISGAEAIGRLAKGDIVGGALAGAEAITSLIPGLGTAVSTGLGAAGLARDLKRTRQAVGAARKLGKTGRDAYRRGIVGTNSLTKKTFKTFRKNPLATTVGGTGTAIVGTNVADQRSRRRLRLPNLPAPSLTGGSAGFRTAG